MTLGADHARLSEHGPVSDKNVVNELHAYKSCMYEFSRLFTAEELLTRVGLLLVL